MFKKFTESESVSGVTQVKSSVIRNIRSDLLKKYPPLEEYADVILPKKGNYKMVKCHERIEILAVNGDPIFFRQRDDFYPSLRLLHKFAMAICELDPVAFQLTKHCCKLNTSFLHRSNFASRAKSDKGAIRFILSGANIMCRGLTSPGATLSHAEKEDVVVSL
ncbi:putative malignant T-cell-amplified sequence 1 [Apostichopus japonicus]|uniref:Putative malignant T-cell-amplified sequence 1 n=1 Tax=Stichopus japonicus TaxID=307972 RepID=A0A2G8KI11_STIJA|nr:putative malignant T-cell-amplified sequence 1 [Apostichopus japonicus]